MKCFIFSNCLKSTPNNFLKNIKILNIKPEDILIFLNKGNLIYSFKEYFTYFKHKHIFMRQFKRFGIAGYFGFEDVFAHSDLFETVNGIANNNSEIIIQSGKLNKTDSTIINFTCTDIQKYIEKTKRIPTTGYLAYYIAPKLFPIKENDIILVNFYGNADNSTGKWNGHAWTFEDTWLKTKNEYFVKIKGE